MMQPQGEIIGESLSDFPPSFPNGVGVPVRVHAEMGSEQVLLHLIADRTAFIGRLPRFQHGGHGQVQRPAQVADEMNEQVDDLSLLV